MLWIRRGWEVTVAALQSSVNEFRGVNPGSRGAFWPNHITKNAAAHPFYKALTAVGPRRQVWHYHEGSFYPIATVKRFSAYLHDWMTEHTRNGTCVVVRDCQVPSSRIQGLHRRASTLPRNRPEVTEIVGTYPMPEEFWLPAFALNVEQLSPRAEPSQLCWREERKGRTVELAQLMRLRNNAPVAPDEVYPMATRNRSTSPLPFYAVKRVAQDPADPIVSDLRTRALADDIATSPSRSNVVIADTTSLDEMARSRADLAVAGARARGHVDQISYVDHRNVDQRSPGAGGGGSEANSSVVPLVRKCKTRPALCDAACDEQLLRNGSTDAYQQREGWEAERLLGSNVRVDGELLSSPDDACETVGEPQAFRHLCAHRIQLMDAHLREAAAARRALVIEYQSGGASGGYGYGHLLTASYALHHLCYRLRRVCYIRLFDSDLGSYFGYANGQSWDPQAVGAEPSRYSSNSTVVWARTQPHRLLQRLEGETAGLLKLILLGNAWHLLMNDWLPWTVPLRRPPDASAFLIDRCFCRYVSEPRFTLPDLGLRNGSLAFNYAFHLRTGYADLQDRQLAAHRGDHEANLAELEAVTPSPASVRPGLSSIMPGPATVSSSRATVAQGEIQSAGAALWLGAACGQNLAASFGRGATVVISDSPGLARYLHSRFGVYVPALNAAFSHRAITTRSWSVPTAVGSAAKLLAVTDLYLAGLGRYAQTTENSGFLRPAVARSVCTARVDFLSSVARGGACVNFSRVFLRDVHKHVQHGRYQHTWSCTAAHMIAGHPCENGTSADCRRRFVAATQA